MSIDEILERLENEGRLVGYPVPEGFERKRVLYLTAALLQEFEDRNSSLNFFGQMRAARIVFNRWVTGGPVVVRIGGRGAGALLARLEPPPDDIWEFRVTEPKPQLRIFARFAKQDVLVATAAANRDRLGTAFWRSNKQSKAWSEAMYDCLSEWNRLFGGTPAFRGSAVGDYVSENCIGSE